MEKYMTIEKLQSAVSECYGAVVQYGDKVFVVDLGEHGDFTAEIYEFIEFPENTGLGYIECSLILWEVTDETFMDNGHAMQWCFDQVK